VQDSVNFSAGLLTR